MHVFNDTDETTCNKVLSQDSIHTPDKGFLDRGSREQVSGMFWSSSLFWILITAGFCHSDRDDAIHAASDSFLKVGGLSRPQNLELGDSLDTCGIFISGGLAGGEIYPWATQTTEVL